MTEPGPIRRDPKYRPNHDRSITISGIIDEALVSRLLPEIVRLQSVSRDPITVYVDSPGGDTECAKLLLDALRTSDQDRSEPCRLITVVLGEASSAAADILMAGDYAIVYPYSRILCHGIRIRPQSAFTKDQAATYARLMTGRDENFALTLARNCIDRFMFRAMEVLKKALGSKRIESSRPFTVFGLIRMHLAADALLSDKLIAALDLARERAEQLAAFSGEYGLFDDRAKTEPAGSFKDKVRTALLNHALQSNTSQAEPFSNLERDYLLLCDFFEPHHVGIVARLFLRWGSDLLTVHATAPPGSDGNSETAKPPSDADIAGTLCTELWFCFVSFCRQLQTDDFPMTATEAYWLGLIDEVIGLDLPSPRILVENAPDIPSTLQQGFDEGLKGAASS